MYVQPLQETKFLFYTHRHAFAFPAETNNNPLHITGRQKNLHIIHIQTER